MQRTEQAVVAVADGLPCFSIPQTWETRKGIPFEAISVTELTSVDWKSLPLRYWGMAIQPPGSSMLLRAQTCLRYGEKPANIAASMDTAKPLEPYHIYSVSISGSPEGSSILAYTAEFCLKPGADGKITVGVIPSNRRDPNRNAVCAKP